MLGIQDHDKSSHCKRITNEKKEVDISMITKKKITCPPKLDSQNGKEYLQIMCLIKDLYTEYTENT